MPSPRRIWPIADGGRYTVVAGDTLSRIAARALGDAERAGEMAALNREAVEDANRVHAGQTLRLPKP